MMAARDFDRFLRGRSRSSVSSLASRITLPSQMAAALRNARPDPTALKALQASSSAEHALSALIETFSRCIRCQRYGMSEAGRHPYAAGPRWSHATRQRRFPTAPRRPFVGDDARMSLTVTLAKSGQGPSSPRYWKSRRDAALRRRLVRTGDLDARGRWRDHVPDRSRHVYLRGETSPARSKRIGAHPSQGGLCSGCRNPKWGEWRRAYRGPWRHPVGDESIHCAERLASTAPARIVSSIRSANAWARRKTYLRQTHATAETLNRHSATKSQEPNMTDTKPRQSGSGRFDNGIAFVTLNRRRSACDERS